MLRIRRGTTKRSTTTALAEHGEQNERKKQKKGQTFIISLVIVLAFASLSIMIRSNHFPTPSSKDHSPADFHRRVLRKKAVESPQSSATDTQIMKIRKSICKPRFINKAWKNLCKGNFVETAARLLMNGEHVDVVQIGAHAGFEENDPIAEGLSRLLDEVTKLSKNDKLRKNLHWTFIEPSPPNYKRLSENVMKHSNLCDMKSINAAVVSDLTEKKDEMIFYSIRDTIDPETGFDSLSNETFPYWVTQISSFSKKQLQHHKGAFSEKGLDVNDYIVETDVETMRYSELMERATKHDKHIDSEQQEPLLVLIDTEGSDCSIIEGISSSSTYLPNHLVFEHNSCYATDTYKHLKNIGYDTLLSGGGDTVAIKNIAVRGR